MQKQDHSETGELNLHKAIKKIISIGKSWKSLNINRTNFESMSDAKFIIKKLLKTEKRDIRSINLNDVGDSIKFFGVLLKPFNVEKSLFSFQKHYRQIHSQDVIRKFPFEIEGNQIFIQLNSESRLIKE